MKNRLVHQWRDWLLKHATGDEYELINKANLSVHKITAKDFMEAETKSQLFISNITKTQK